MNGKIYYKANEGRLRPLGKKKIQDMMAEKGISYKESDTIDDLIVKIDSFYNSVHLAKEKLKNLNIDDLRKSEMKKLLEDAGIRTYYHDTIDQLKEKLRNL
jgi:Ni,Fe-hydrogenase III large subunit